MVQQYKSEKGQRYKDTKVQRHKVIKVQYSTLQWLGALQWPGISQQHSTTQ